jgi:hypothetical protein
VENILITQWTQNFRSLLDVRYLYAYQSGGFLWHQQWGVSYSSKAQEFRLEYRNRQNTPDWLFSYIFFF